MFHAGFLASEDGTNQAILKMMSTVNYNYQVFGLVLAIIMLNPPSFASGKGDRILKVTAAAYNSLPGQTQGDPTITAWGEKLTPGMKTIAVSRDLVKLGLTYGAKVKIEGLPGSYTVMDKLHKRWKLRIDIYMGKDVKAAKKWGKRQVTIRW